MTQPMSLEQRVEVLEAELESVGTELKAILLELRDFIMRQGGPFPDTPAAQEAGPDETE